MGRVLLSKELAQTYEAQMKDSISTLKKKEKQLEDSKDKEKLRAIRKQISEAEAIYSKICPSDHQEQPQINDSSDILVQMRQSIEHLKQKEKELQAKKDI